jgi:hypothetical protein
VVFKNQEDTQKVKQQPTFKINDREILCLPYEGKESCVLKSQAKEDVQDEHFKVPDTLKEPNAENTHKIGGDCKISKKKQVEPNQIIEG